MNTFFTMEMVKEKRNCVYKPGQSGDFGGEESFLGLYAFELTFFTMEMVKKMQEFMHKPKGNAGKALAGAAGGPVEAFKKFLHHADGEKNARAC